MPEIQHFEATIENRTGITGPISDDEIVEAFGEDVEIEWDDDNDDRRPFAGEHLRRVLIPVVVGSYEWELLQRNGRLVKQNFVIQAVIEL